MPIRDLILTNDDPKQALQELKFQWAEMAGVVNALLSHVQTTRTGTQVVGKDILWDTGSYGVVLKDTGGHYWRVGVSTTGVLVTADLGTSKP